MRKWVIATIAGLPVAALAQSATTNGLTNFPRVPKAEIFRETVFTVPIDDPYRWMETAAQRGELEQWVNAASLHTTSELAALPGREGLFKQMEALSRANKRYFSVQEAGGKLFYQVLAPDMQIPVLMVRGDGKDQVLLDPMAGTDGKIPRAILCRRTANMSLSISAKAAGRPERSGSTT